MKMLIRLAAGLGCLVMSVATASAASVEYCTLYARAYAALAALQAQKMGQAALGKDRLQRIYDTSWAKCLNQDEDPELPGIVAETAPSGATDDPSPVGSVPSNAAADPGAGDSKTVVVKASPDQVADAAERLGPRRGSGFKAWTPEWVAWCKSHYRSFDPKTGYVKPYSGERTLCQ